MVYQIIDKIVSQSNLKCSAAEAHGMATGMLCIDEHSPATLWIQELFNDSAPLPEDQQNLLTRLFNETSRLIGSPDFEFDLLLPDDNVDLNVRIAALRSWCQGFLFGVGTGYAQQNFPREATEILKDITEFTRLETDAEGEEDEVAFTEVTEYLRSAVLLLYEELNIGQQNTLH